MYLQLWLKVSQAAERFGVGTLSGARGGSFRRAGPPAPSAKYSHFAYPRTISNFQLTWNCASSFLTQMTLV
jgi:hypothetical protein